MTTPSRDASAFTISLLKAKRQAASLWAVRHNDAARHFYEKPGGGAFAEKEDPQPESTSWTPPTAGALYALWRTGAAQHRGR